MRRLLALACAIATIAAGCGGSDAASTTTRAATSTVTAVAAPTETRAATSTTTSAAAPETDADPGLERLESALERTRRELAIPGMSAAVVRDQQLVWSAGFGYADMSREEPATADTPYHLASVTKPVAATVIMQLVEEGDLSLEDPVAMYGIDLPDAVRVKHLLTHTSSGTPGTVHRYDGSRFGELRKIIEAVTGETFRTVMFERIFEPLGMTRTAGSVLECGEVVDPAILAAGRAVRGTLASPYQLDRQYQVVESEYPMGYNAGAGMIASVVDMARFDAALDNGQLLGEAALNEMLAPVISTWNDSTEQMYGIGWYVQDYDGMRLLWHHGHWPPSVSALYLKVPDLGLTFVVLANTPNLSTPFPLWQGDVLVSTPAQAFFRELVFPLLHEGVRLPDVEWEADATTLASQLSGVTDPDVARFLEKELWSHRMAAHSIGRTDLVERLTEAHRVVYGDSTGLSDFLGSPADTPPEPEVVLDDAYLRSLTGRYVTDAVGSRQFPGDLPREQVTVTLEEGRLIVCSREGSPLTLVPIADNRFRGPSMGSQRIYADVQLEAGRVSTLTIHFTDEYVYVLRPAPVDGGANLWRRVEPEAAGWSSTALEDVADLATEMESAAIFAARDRDVFFSWGATESKLPIHSIRKPLLSALYGIHVAAGDIDLDATLEQLGIDDTTPALTVAEKQATVRDLLMSRSGVYHEAAAEAPLMEETRPERGSHPPGTFYYYNNWDFNVLGTIFRQQTGLGVCEAFRIEIAHVIGMEDFEAQDCFYDYEWNKSRHPAYPLRMTSRDLARFGLLYLRGGEWNGDQVVPRDWIEESWTPYSKYDPDGVIGVGYMWMTIATADEPDPAAFPDMYFHTGAGVHVLAIVPDLDLVLVHRMDTTGPFPEPGEDLGRLLSMVIQAGSRSDDTPG